MNDAHVLHECRTPSERFLAHVAPVRLFIGVRDQVTSQVVLLDEIGGTKVARVRPLERVVAHVSPKLLFGGKFHAAQEALERHLALVTGRVHRQSVLADVRCWAQAASVRPLARVSPHVVYKEVVACETPAAYVTCKGLLSCVHALVALQIFPPMKLVAAHSARVPFLIAVRAKVPPHGPLAA